MTIETDFARLFRYNSQSNRKILEFMLSGDPVNPRAAKIFAHMIGADKMWLSMLELGEKAPEPVLWPDMAPEMFKEELESVSGHWTRYLDAATDETLSAEISYLNIKGQTVRKSASDILTSALIHASYHRGQVAILSGGGERTAPLMDFIFFSE